MPSTPSLLEKLKLTYPHLSFKSGRDFSWDFTSQTITYPSPTSDDSWSAHLLHELAHAELGHQRYHRDIDLIGKERDAWAHATDHLSAQFGISISPAVIQSAMDSYRDWLHDRSTCPQCQATGLETRKNTYRCVACGQSWKVNEARICHLRRYQIQK